MGSDGNAVHVRTKSKASRADNSIIGSVPNVVSALMAELRQAIETDIYEGTVGCRFNVRTQVGHRIPAPMERTTDDLEACARRLKQPLEHMSGGGPRTRLKQLFRQNDLSVKFILRFAESAGYELQNRLRRSRRLRMTRLPTGAAYGRWREG